MWQDIGLQDLSYLKPTCNCNVWGSAHITNSFSWRLLCDHLVWL